MAGALSSLGMGSGVLTYDIIDQLKEADTEKLMGPNKKNLEKSEARSEALEELMEIVSDFEDLQDDLSDEMTWLKRKTKITGDEAEVDVSGGVKPQTINLHIDQLAKQDILESKRFNSRDFVVITEPTQLNIFIDEKSYSVDLDTGTKLSELAGKFFNQTGEKVIGSALKVGGENPYKLILKSAEAGDSSRILMGTTKMGEDTDLSNLETGNLDKTFFINGIDIFEGKTKDDLGSLDKVIDAINAQQDKTKVVAYESKDGKKIIFNNANAGVIDFTGGDFDTDGVLDRLGIDIDTLNKKAVSTMGDKLGEELDGGETLDAGDFKINGIDMFSDFLYGGERKTSIKLADWNNNTEKLQVFEQVASIINQKTGDWYDKDGLLQKGTGISVEVDITDTDDFKLKFSSEKNISIKFEGDRVSDFKLDDKDVENTTETSSKEDIDTSKLPQTFGKYEFYINNKQVLDDETTFDNLDDIVTAINNKESLTGVKAEKDGDKIKFINDSGGSITFNQSSDNLIEFLQLEGQGVAGPDAESNLLELLEYDHDSLYDNGFTGQTSSYKQNSTARVQTPQDAIFKFNGVEITRNTNNIDDLIVGADITLLKVHKGNDDITKIEVERDDEDIKEKFKDIIDMIDVINEKIMELIEYDNETKKIGPLQGVQQITSISSTMTKHLLTYDSTLDKFKSMIGLGLEIEKDGKLKIDFEKFNKKLDDDPTDVEKLFRGYDTVILGEDRFIDGIWTKINKSLDEIISDDDSALQVLKKKYEKEQVSYTDEIEETRLEIEAKYERMASKFGAYDGMIAGMKNSFAPFEQMMAASYS